MNEAPEPNDGPSKLRVWLKLKDKTQAQFASDMGVSGATVQNWLARKYGPSVTRALKIEEETAGIVEVKDWVR